MTTSYYNTQIAIPKAGVHLSTADRSQTEIDILNTKVTRISQMISCLNNSSDALDHLVIAETPTAENIPEVLSLGEREWICSVYDRLKSKKEKINKYQINFFIKNLKQLENTYIIEQPDSLLSFRDIVVCSYNLYNKMNWSFVRAFLLDSLEEKLRGTELQLNALRTNQERHNRPKLNDGFRLHAKPTLRPKTEIEILTEKASFLKAKTERGTFTRCDFEFSGELTEDRIPKIIGFKERQLICTVYNEMKKAGITIEKHQYEVHIKSKNNSSSLQSDLQKWNEEYRASSSSCLLSFEEIVYSAYLILDQKLYPLRDFLLEKVEKELVATQEKLSTLQGV